MKKRTVIEALNWASSFLSSPNSGTAAEWLLMHHLKYTRSQLLKQFNTVLSQEVWERFERGIRLHNKGVPLQHLTGEEHFYGRVFHVNRHVLIPRPETEELVDAVLAAIEKRFSDRAVRGADIGTGSGVIAITLALEAGVGMVATDISERALKVARTNAARYKASVQFRKGHLLEPLVAGGDRFDVVVSNPPYVKRSDIHTLAPVVRDYEPRLALDGGESGLEKFAEITNRLPEVLKEQAIVAFEVGLGQAANVADLLQTKLPAAHVAIIKDLNRKERIVLAEIGF